MMKVSCKTFQNSHPKNILVVDFHLALIGEKNLLHFSLSKSKKTQGFKHER
jgi:hypothetical protein